MDSQIPTQTNNDAPESTKQEWQSPELKQIGMEDTESGAFISVFETGLCCIPS